MADGSILCVVPSIGGHLISLLVVIMTKKELLLEKLQMQIHGFQCEDDICDLDTSAVTNLTLVQGMDSSLTHCAMILRSYKNLG